eukprot:scaffold67163_cov66-Phaeocystis_antarctica.AAC.2
MDNEQWNGMRHATWGPLEGTPNSKQGHLAHFVGSCEAHAVGHDAREPDGVKEQDHVQEHPRYRQYDGRQAVIALAQCVAQHESLVQVTLWVGDLIAHLRCDDNLHDNDEMEDEAKLPRHRVVKDRGGGRDEH